MRLAFLVLILAALFSWARFAIADAELIASEAQVNAAVRRAPRAAKASISAKLEGGSGASTSATRRTRSG